MGNKIPFLTYGVKLRYLYFNIYFSRGGSPTIADYNFNGFDNVAFSIPDAGMGVYRTFSIYLYNPKSKRFNNFVVFSIN